MTTLADLDLTRLEALAEKATPGEWWASEAIGDDEDAVLVGVTREDAPDGYAVIVATPGDASFAIEPTNRDADAEFIAALRNAAPSLLAATRAVQRVEALLDQYDRYEEPMPSDRRHGRIPRAEVRAALGGAE